jgi:hypothetical protein
MPSIFSYSSTFNATAKSIYKMHVTVLGIGKHKRHCFSTSKLTADCEVTAGIQLACM